MNTIRHLILLAALAVNSSFAADLKAFTDIAQIQTVKGPAIHQEDSTGRSHLYFRQENRLFALSPAWRDLAIEQVVQLNRQTALVLSYRDETCPSRLSLLVIDKLVTWGPYLVGNCEDMVVHQVSLDRNDYIAIKANGKRGEAYSYSAVEQRFRGPIDIDLPPGMAAILQPSAPAARSQTVKTEAKRPIVPPAPRGVTSKEAGELAKKVRSAPAHQPIRLEL